MSEYRISDVLYSEARRHNSHLGRTNLDESLAPLVLPSGAPSEHFPASLRVLFSYEREFVIFIGPKIDLMSTKYIKM